MNVRNLQVHVGHVSEVSLHRTVEFKPLAATVKGPLRAVDAARQLNTAGLHLPAGMALNEVMFQPDLEILATVAKNPGAGAELTKVAARKRDFGARAGLPTIAFTVLDGLNLGDRAVEDLADAAYNLGDIVAIPTVDKPQDVLADPKNRARLVAVQKRFLEIVEGMNHKAVAACFPDGGTQFCQDQVEWAAGHGIRFFAYDFNAYGATSQEVPVRTTLRALKAAGILDESVTYAWNLRRMTAGGMPKGSGIQRATDVLAWGMGFDIIGESRRNRFLAKKQVGRVALDPRPRFFNGGTYGYEHVSQTVAAKVGRELGATSVAVKDPRWVRAAQHMADYRTMNAEAGALAVALKGKAVAAHLASKTLLSPEARHKMSKSHSDLRSKHQQTRLYF